MTTNEILIMSTDEQVINLMEKIKFIKDTDVSYTIMARVKYELTIIKYIKEIKKIVKSLKD